MNEFRSRADDFHVSMKRPRRIAVQLDDCLLTDLQQASINIFDRYVNCRLGCVNNFGERVPLLQFAACEILDMRGCDYSIDR